MPMEDPVLPADQYLFLGKVFFFALDPLPPRGEFDAMAARLLTVARPNGGTFIPCFSDAAAWEEFAENYPELVKGCAVFYCQSPVELLSLATAIEKAGVVSLGLDIREFSRVRSHSVGSLIRGLREAIAASDPLPD